MQIAVLLTITLSSTLCYLVLLILVLLGGAWRGVNRVFAAYLGFSILWNLGGFLMFLDPQQALFWNKILVLGLLGVFFSFFYFVWLFLNRKGSPLWLYLGMVAFAALAALNFAGLVISQITVAEDRFEYEIGPAMPFVFAVGYVYLGLATFYLVQRYRAVPDEFYRNKVRYPIVGLSIMMMSGATNAVPALGALGLDHLGNLVMALLVGYAVLRYKLLDLSLVLRRGLIYSTLTVTITAFYLLATVVLYAVLQSITGYSLIITALVIALLVAVVFLPMRNLFQRWIDRLFYREQFDYRDMLRAAGRGMTEILNLAELFGTTMDIVGRVLHIQKASLFVLESHDYVCSPSLRRGYLELADQELKLRKDSPIATQLATQSRSLNLEEIKTLPRFRGLWKEERELLKTLAASLFLPLKGRGQLVGALVFGPKLSGESYSTDEVDLLSTLADHLGIAVDNARLFEEVKHSYEQLQSAQDYLVQSERLRALGQMASGVAHDFNNLLAAILGRAQLALGVAKDEKVIRNLKIIEEAALGGAATVQRLQTFTQVRTGQNFTLVNLNEIAEATLRMVEAQRKEREQMAGIQVEVVTQLEKLPPVSGNAGDLRDALTNMVLNAFDAMPQGGQLTVRTRQQNDLAVVSVTDTGIGMSEEVKKRIFDPFFTTKGTRGMGLGLSVAYGVVTRHGGKIEVETQLNKGSTFYVKIPISTAAAEAKEPVPTPSQPRAARVLLVDDDREVGEVLQEMLSRGGFAVTLATSGREALALFKQDKYDLVITDLGMPDISGRDVALEINTRGPRVPVILITGWGVQLDPKEMAKVGIQHILAKPFGREELLSRVAQVLKAAG